MDGEENHGNIWEQTVFKLHGKFETPVVSEQNAVIGQSFFREITLHHGKKRILCFRRFALVKMEIQTVQMHFRILKNIFQSFQLLLVDRVIRIIRT